MRWTIIILLLYAGMITFGQSYHPDTIRFRLMADKQEPLVGANLFVRGSDPPYGSISNGDGYAELVLQKESYTIEISFMGPYVAIPVMPPLDSVYIYLNKKKIYYYNNNKTVRKEKLYIQ